MSEVPKIVKEAAEEEGYNYVEFAGDYKDSKAYSVGIIDKDGMFVPIGMPRFLLLTSRNEVRYASDDESQEIVRM